MLKKESNFLIVHILIFIIIAINQHYPFVIIYFVFLFSTSGNFDDDLNESLLGEQAFEENNPPNDESLDNEIATTFRSQANQKIKKAEKETITPFQSKLITFLEQTGGDDPDKQVLLSLLPDYRNLNASQKLDFRINALNFFKIAHQSNNSNSSSITNHPNPYQNDNSYQHSSSLYLPPNRQPEINNTYYNG